MQTVTMSAKALKLLLDRLYVLDAVAGEAAPEARPELTAAVIAGMDALEGAGLAVATAAPGRKLADRIQPDAVPLCDYRVENWLADNSRVGVAREVQMAAQSVFPWLTFDADAAPALADAAGYFPKLLETLRREGFHTYQGRDGFAVFAPYDRVTGPDKVEPAVRPFKRASPSPV